MLIRYTLVWLLLALVAVINGILREGTYGKIIPELAAHQLSTATAIILSGATVWVFHRSWPIQSATQAWLIGIIWLVLTVAFEFGFGHYAAGKSWPRLLADYDLLSGRVWLLFLVWVTIMPYVFFRYS